MRQHFHYELSQIQEQIHALGQRVLQNVQMATQALLNADSDQAQSVLQSENAVDALEVRIEERCLTAIALHHPVADDLRFLITIIRADQDLERISDLAANIAKTARRVSAADLAPYRDDFAALGAQVYAMVEDGLQSLLTQDSEGARATWLGDQTVDAMRDTLTQRLRSDIVSQSQQGHRLFEVIDAVNRFERMADHAANMAKAVLYLVLGRIVRHRAQEFRQAPAGAKTRVLFVCVHNSARSQMAAAWMNHLYGAQFVAESAGLSPGTLNPLAVRVMQECGLDISANVPRDVLEAARTGARFDYVIAVCDAASAERCPPMLGIAEQAQWEFVDPAQFQGPNDERLQKTRQVRDAIRARIELWVAELSHPSYS